MRVINFAAGPATLPLPVLERAQKDLIEHGGDGMSVMEMSHRSPMYKRIIEGAEASLRTLMGIPDDYAVLFLQGGASTQFAMVPMNLMHTGKADYVVSGNFAGKAATEAKKYGAVNVVATSKPDGFSYVPHPEKGAFDPAADYVHITTNNTIYGTSVRQNLPDTGDVPLVADMSSNILSEVYDVNKFGLIYAGAQKNIGIAGLTLVIAKKELLEKGPIADYVPSMLTYKLMLDNGSMYNTPPAFAIYMAGLVFDHLLENGGVAAMQKENEAKAKLLYDYLDASTFYTGKAKEDRSLMNVTFFAPTEELNAKFVKEAAQNGIVNIKGHRAAGGMRASIYNAMDFGSVAKLLAFMQMFEAANI